MQDPVKNAPFRALVCDAIHESGLNALKKAGDIDVDLRPGIEPDELLRVIRQYDALLIRSRTNINAEMIQAADRLKAIGRAGVGLDNVDIEAATRRGVIVMNSPGGNTVAAAEHSITMMLALSRNIAPANAALLRGEFDARTRMVGVELYNKTLGVFGLGRIGIEVAKRAAAFGMRVVGRDPYISDEVASQQRIHLMPFEELIQTADYITIHVPLTRETYHRFGRREFSRMKPTARIINCARGGVIDEDALLDALKDGEIAGAALDVFEDEPNVNMRLAELPNALTTPHLGGSTREAQEFVARDIARQVSAALRGLPVENAVNMPSLDARAMESVGPYVSLAEKLGSIQAQLSRGEKIQEVGIEYAGDIFEGASNLVASSLQKGILSRALAGRVNYVNAPVLIRQRGIRLLETRSSGHPVYANLLTVTVVTSKERRSIGGTVFGNQERIVMIDQYHTSAMPEGCMLFVYNYDQPGMIGRVGTILGSHDINISDMSVGRVSPKGLAVMAVNIDSEAPDEAIREIAAIERIHEVKYVVLS